MGHFDGRVEEVKISVPTQGPYQLRQVETIPAESKRGGTWRLSWPDGMMLFEGWKKALDWLDDQIAKQRIDSDALLLAGPLSVPWLLDWYLIASDEAEKDNREGVFDAYAKSARLILDSDKQYREKLLEPWVEEQRAT